MNPSTRSNRPSLLAAAGFGLLALGASTQVYAQHGVPDGTLAYTLVVAGHAHTTANDGSSIASRINWRAEGKFHLKGLAAASPHGDPNASNAGALSSSMTGMEQAISACGNDDACLASTAMRYAQTRRPGDADASVAALRHGTLGRNPNWQFLSGECSATATVNDSETDSGTDIGEGYSRAKSEHGTRVGKHSLECKFVGGGLKMTGDSSRQTYALTIPWLDIPVTVSGDEMGSEARTLHRQDLKPAGLRLRPLHDVQHGSKVIHHTMTASPVYGMATRIPVRETVTWTFTPDKG